MVHSEEFGGAAGAGPDLAERLRSARIEAAARAAALTADLEALMAAAESSNADDEHDPEGSTLAFEREQLRALLGAAREQDLALQQAELRLADGDYGQCERCGEAIGAERLAARPGATRCRNCAAVGGPR